VVHREEIDIAAPRCSARSIPRMMTSDDSAVTLPITVEA
jgi:hypothetical protein